MNRLAPRTDLAEGVNSAMPPPPKAKEWSQTLFAPTILLFQNCLIGENVSVSKNNFNCVLSAGKVLLRRRNSLKGDKNWRARPSTRNVFLFCLATWVCPPPPSPSKPTGLDLPLSCGTIWNYWIFLETEPPQKENPLRQFQTGSTIYSIPRMVSVDGKASWHAKIIQMDDRQRRIQRPKSADLKKSGAPTLASQIWAFPLTQLRSEKCIMKNGGCVSPTTSTPRFWRPWLSAYWQVRVVSTPSDEICPRFCYSQNGTFLLKTTTRNSFSSLSVSETSGSFFNGWQTGAHLPPTTMLDMLYSKKNCWFCCMLLQNKHVSMKIKPGLGNNTFEVWEKGKKESPRGREFAQSGKKRNN